MNSQSQTRRVGVLHSLKGTMAKAETHLVSATQMAIDEINARGGVLGSTLEMVTRDGESDPDCFARHAERLIQEEGITTLFGCWTSAARKAVKPIVEDADAVLWYPLQYEGLEESPNIIYTGSCLNQQIEPAVQWAFSQGKQRCLLLGSDYVFPRTANSLLRSMVEVSGGTVLDEIYVPFGSEDFEKVMESIARFQPDIIYNTMNGDGNLTLFRKLSQAGLFPKTCMVLSFSFSEIEAQEVAQEAEGSYACWNYFSSLQIPENIGFKARYYERYGEHAPLSVPIITAYIQVFLWKQLVEIHETFDCRTILSALKGASVIGPAGYMELEANHHTRKHARIGRANIRGDFDIVWSSDSPILPRPWVGVEDTDLPSKRLILDAMNQFPEVNHLNWRLKQEISSRRQIAKERELLIADLQKEILMVKILSGFIPICSQCKRAKDQDGHWRILEEFIQECLEVQLTHSLCPNCVGHLYPGYGAA